MILVLLFKGFDVRVHAEMLSLHIWVQCEHVLTRFFFFCIFCYVTGLYLVGEKGEKGLPGPPGHCDCDSTVVANSAPFGSYTQRGGPNKVPAVRPTHMKLFLCFY